MKKRKDRKKLYNRVISMFLGFAFTLNAVSFDVFNGAFSISSPMNVHAAAETYTPSNSNKDRFAANGTAFANNDTGKADFLDFCYFYETDDSFAAQYANSTISVSFITFPENYSGFGNANVKFSGDFRIQDTGTSVINIPCALFTHVYDSAKITNNNGQPLTLKIVKTSDQSSALVADHVYHDVTEGAVPSSWDITTVSSNTNSYAGVIGVMEEDAKLAITYTNNSSADVSSTSDGTETTADVGSVCGTMKTGSELTVSISNLTNVNITSANGNAGGLVGDMEGTSELVISSLPANYAPTVSAPSTDDNKGYAGGIVGSLLSSATVDTSALEIDAFNINGTISGGNAAGGYSGRYINSAEDAELDLSKYDITATLSGTYIGGVFGLLENQSEKYTITGGAGETPSIHSNARSGTYGGVIGKYTTTALSNTLYLKDMNASATATASLDYFGGAIGLVDSAAYIKAENVNITAAGVDKGWFGGLIGETSETSGVFVDLGNFTLSANGFSGGGVVGKFHKGVLRLSGTTNMTAAKVGATWTSTGKYGQLVGENDNVLVYAVGSGNDENWTFKRSTDSIADDLGTWGSVVRIANIETNIVTLDATNHTVTLEKAETAMDSAEDLVLTALNIQLNQGDGYDCLLFADNTSSKRSDLLAHSLSVSGTQSFSGTGITGFMRDGGNSVGEFTGTFTGGTLELAIGEKYGYNVTSDSTGEGLGQIYRHPYNGLFSVAGKITDDAEFTSLTLTGNVNVRNAGMAEMYIGGLAAKADGSVTINGVTASQTVNYHQGGAISSSEATGKNIGGLIGCVTATANGSEFKVTGTTELGTTFNLSGNHANWNVLGSYIGKVLSPAFTITIGEKDSSTNKLTDKHTTTVADGLVNGGDADGEGLIGYIAATSGEYSDREIKINNLIFDGCELVNAANTNGGGLLGFKWFNTDTTIDDLTVTDATITNSSPANVGAMCYQATGKWTVNKLAVDGLTMIGGAGSSLGMLVNKAYSGNDGLYLDVLNSGYTYTTFGITLPSSGIYDELAAYTAKSADNVVKGYTTGGTDNGVGIISINMGTRNDSVVSVASTGTYQNKMTSQTKPNKLSRYYYNLDKMKSSDATQDVVLWSVKKYVSENINGEFSASESPLNKGNKTEVNFTGISFYPLYSVAGNTVKNVDITFDYEGLYNAEALGNTDSYTRDPGAIDTVRNQHYLMQSGLFIQQGEGSTLSVTKTSLAGTFLEVGDYNGVLISTVTHGSVAINDLELDGITPKTTDLGDNSETGYLLINRIRRENSQAGIISFQVENVRTGTETGKTYAVENSATIQVAKSLFGDVYGPGLTISFEKIKLDAREKGTLSSNTALNTAYGTTNSIFTAATFFNKLETDSNATPTYNYTYEEDWGEGGSGGDRVVTYGKEVSKSVENADKQHKYYKEELFTSPETSSQSGEYNFSSGWLPYVAEAYTEGQTSDSNGCYKREIRVNVFDVITSEGCGTYNDPYIIDSDKADTLVSIANFLNTGNGEKLKTITLPLTKGNYGEVTGSTLGARWCDKKEHHAVFTYESGNYKYTPAGGSEVIWTADEVRLYLESAYYMIDGEITLAGGFPGLGGDTAKNDTTGKYAFRGVIVGRNNATITNNSQNPLISISNGCVVKNITVVQGADVTLKQYKSDYTDGAFGYKTPTQKNENNAGCAYYGGIIGEIMGGDNIIDNCYVQQAENIKVTLDGGNSSELISPVGSYVGVVVFGGLIFKNMSSTTANTNASSFKVYYKTNTDNNLTANTEAAKAAIYVNPYVGRVINGYAVNETTQFSVTENGEYHDDDTTPRTAADGSGLTKHSLKNTAKHYTIADINKNDTSKLDVSDVPTSTVDGKINIPNSQAFFILSLITQSCAGTAQTADGDYKTSLSYGIYSSNNIYGKSHIADYSNVGAAASDQDSDYLLASKDTAGNTNKKTMLSRISFITTQRILREIKRGISMHAVLQAL